MSASAALKRAIYDALRTNAALAALLATSQLDTGSPTVPAVYDFVPQPAAPEDAALFPYVAIGDDTSAEADTDDINFEEHTVTLHVWDRREGSTRVKQIQDAIYAVLHRASLEIAGQTTVYCYYEFKGSIPDPEPLTQHGVIRFRILTQQN
jgi:hypothetical protein